MFEKLQAMYLKTCLCSFKGASHPAARSHIQWLFELEGKYYAKIKETSC